MSFGLLWRASLALAVGLLVSFLGLRFITGADGPPSPGHESFLPRLTLIRQASRGELISLQIAPFEVGPNDFRVTLLDPLGRQQKLSAARVRFSRLESAGILGEVDSTPAGESREAAYGLAEPGWWQIDVIVGADSVSTFYLKLDQSSNAPRVFAPPNDSPDPRAQQVFQTALARYEALTGLKWREELTTGDAGGSNRFGVWFITDIDSNTQGLHARTLNMAQGSSELYSGKDRQCFRQSRDAWQCTSGAAPIGPFDLSYLQNATGFRNGRTEVIDGEMTQVIFFYSPSQGAWYAWWVDEQSHLLRRQAMVANGHFMLDRYSGHDAATTIVPNDLPAN